MLRQVLYTKEIDSNCIDVVEIEIFLSEIYMVGECYMADQLCSACGKKIGGVFGQAVPSQAMLDRANKYGVCSDGFCQMCLMDVIDKHQMDENYESNEVKNELKRILLAAMSEVFITPAQPTEGRDCGLILGYSAMPGFMMSDLANSWSDFWGLYPNTSMQIVREAEESALSMLKLEALKKGGDSVYCCKLSFTEMKKDPCMLMVSASGTAVNRQKKPIRTDVVKAIEFFSNS